MTRGTLSPFPAIDMLARRIFLAGILAGLVAGAFVTAVQAVKIWPLIAAAEVYEKAGETAAAAHAVHDHGASPLAVAEWEPEDGAERIVFTLLANILVATGFGLLLSAGFALRDAYGGVPVDARSGLFWGMAGFAAFQLAPSFGLAPEPPGAVAADLLSRQSWWLATAAATAGGIALAVFGRRPLWKLLGIAAIVAPHVIGAPLPEHPGGSAPPELAAQFVAASLVTAALFWLVLGGFGGWLYGRLARSG
jgi:cobalt transporter subunit CbtA